jgi:hypothetical protein
VQGELDQPSASNRFTEKARTRALPRFTSAGSCNTVEAGHQTPGATLGAKALADVRHMAAREGCCFHHVQTIIVSVDQYVGRVS